jgi:hypothetical protein
MQKVRPLSINQDGDAMLMYYGASIPAIFSARGVYVQ